MRICIVTPAKIGLTETFIQAHLENLPHEVIHIHGYWLEYTWKGLKLREWYKEKYGDRARWLNVLPRFLEFRLRRRFFPPITDLGVVRKFLESQKIDAVLAEYGTAGAFIAPVCEAAQIPLVAHFHGMDASRHKILEEFSDGNTFCLNPRVNYHLPLDAHPVLGNNAGLALALGLDAEREPFGAYKGQTIGTAGRFAAPLPFDAVSARVSEAIGAPAFQSGDPNKPIKRVAICSGGAPDLLYEAVDSGYDLFLTGEATEWVKAVAEETDTAFIAAGHHATERFGPRAMAAALDAEEGLSAQFIDIPNPL
jgi:hypothetical protein